MASRASSRLTHTLMSDRPWVGIGLVSILYWLLTLYMASKRMLWIDEFLTLYSVRLKTVADVWKFMLTGGDQTPPYFMILTHALDALFGRTDWSLRIPAMIGFWILILCLYRIVSHLTSPIFGLVAMVFPMATPIYYYAAEARGYGLFMGFSALSFLFWLDSDTSNVKRRTWNLIGLAASLCLATCCHYYGVLLPIPLSMGEIYRAIRDRKLLLGVWIAFFAVLIPFPPVYAAIAAARQGMKIFWFKPKIYYSFTWFDVSVSGGTLAALLVAFPIAFLRGAWGNFGPLRPQLVPPIKPDKATLTALLGYLAFPVICILFAVFATGAYFPRYALPAVVGISALFSLAASRLARNDAVAGACVLLVLVVFAGGYAVRQVSRSGEVRDDLADYRELSATEALQGAPILFANVQDWMRVKHYLNGQPETRAIYATNPDPLLNQVLMVWLLEKFRPIMSLDLRKLSSVQSRPGIFGIYLNTSKDERWDEKWLLAALLKDGWLLRTVAAKNNTIMVLAEHK